MRERVSVCVCVREREREREKERKTERGRCNKQMDRQTSKALLRQVCRSKYIYIRVIILCIYKL